MFKDVPGLSSCNLFFWLIHLCQGGEAVKVFRNIRVIDSTVMLCHFQGAMSQQLLEHERITATINKIFPGKGVAVKMGACFLHAPGLIVPCHR